MPPDSAGEPRNASNINELQKENGENLSIFSVSYAVRDSNPGPID